MSDILVDKNVFEELSSNFGLERFEMTEEYSNSTTCPFISETLIGEEVYSDQKRYPDISEQNNFFEVFKYDNELTKKQADIWQLVKVSR